MKYLASNAPSAPLLNGGLNGNSVMDDEGGGTLFMCSWEQVERNVDRALDLRLHACYTANKRTLLMFGLRAI